MKKGIERQSHNFNGMHRIHISIPEKEYQQIQEASSKMGISISMFINSYLKYGGFRELIALAKKIDNTPKSVHIVFDDEETSEQVTKLTAAMSSYSSQLRRIGTNLSSLKKGGSTNGKPNQTQPHLQSAIPARSSSPGSGGQPDGG